MHGLFCLQYRDSPSSVPHCRRTIVSDASSLFDNTQFAPDAVLLNLGTNDVGHDSGPAWEAAFTAAYAQFLVDLTATHQNPTLVCVHDGLRHSFERSVILWHGSGVWANPSFMNYEYCLLSSR
jgi:hypothetical protein